MQGRLPSLQAEAGLSPIIESAGLDWRAAIVKDNVPESLLMSAPRLRHRSTILAQVPDPSPKAQAKGGLLKEHISLDKEPSLALILPAGR